MAESFDTIVALFKKEAARRTDWQGVNMTEDEFEGYVERLQVAHESELALYERKGYERGRADGERARDARLWQVEPERRRVAHELARLDLGDMEDSHARLAAIARVVREPDCGWTYGACESLVARLMWLLTGESEDAGEPERPRCACMESGQVVPREDYDSLLDLLRDAAAEYKALDESWCETDDDNDRLFAQGHLLAEENKRLRKENKRLKRKARRKGELADALGKDCDTLLDVLRRLMADKTVTEAR